MNGTVRVAHLATIDLTVKALLLPQLTAMRDAGYDVTAVSAPGPMIDAVTRAGIRHVPWPHATRAWDPAADARAFAELVSILRRERFHIVHTHNAKPGVMGRMAARFFGVPCVVNTVHGFDATSDDPLLKRAAFMSAERVAAMFSDVELFQGREDLQRAVRTAMVSRRRAVFLGNGTDLRRFDPGRVDPRAVTALRQELGIAEGQFVVGTIGRLVAEKGYRELFEAIRLVRARRPDVHLLVVGDRDPAKQDGLTDQEMDRARVDTSFAGWRDDIPVALAAMDIFALPSYREGVPRSAIEAAAMARPLVLSDIPGCRQVARHEREALLVPVGRPEPLAAAILRLVRDPALRGRLGEAARRRAREDFDEQRVIATVLNQYERLLARKGVRT